MIITKQSVDRRTFLRGAGVTLALPFLDAMVPALSAVTDKVVKARRLGVVYSPNGLIREQWIPSTVGAGFELPGILKPLASFADQVTVVSGLSSNPARPIGDEGAGDHARACATFLTGEHPRKTQGYDVRAGVSLDQVAASRLGRDMPLSSLELGLDSTEFVGSCDFNYSCSYVQTISWRTPTTPLPMEINPRLVFERLFGDSESTDPKERLTRLRNNRSILDTLRETIQLFEKGLGPQDRGKVAEYLDAVRDVERRIQNVESQGAKEIPLVDRPIGIPATFQEHAELMFELQALAYQADLTRVGTFMLGAEVTGRSYPELGVPEASHTLSHHQYDPARMAKQAKVNTFHMTLFAKYLERLRSTPDGDGSLLDHTAILYGASLGDSQTHSHDNLPILLAGGGAGELKGGHHVQYPVGTPLANLHLSLLHILGVEDERFGDSTGTLRELSFTRRPCGVEPLLTARTETPSSDGGFCQSP